MKAYAALEPGKAGFVNIPIPEPGDYEALVKIEACVVCNSTDWMVINRHFGSPGYPVLIGHESFGKVVRIGSKVRNLKPGDRVTRANAIPSKFDGTYYSAWGGFAEYGIVADYEALKEDGFDNEASKCISQKKIPADLPLEKAGLVIALSETASCLMQMEPVEGKSVVVMGTGIAGLSLTYFAKKFGAGKVICTGRRTGRLEIAKRLGADEILLSDDAELRDKIMKITARTDGTAGADYIFEATGKSNVFENGISFLGEGGSIAFYGVPDEPYIIKYGRTPRQLHIFNFKPKEYMATDYVCKLLEEEQLLTTNLLTHKWSFEQLPEAFAEIRSGDVIKGIVLIG